MLTNQFMNKSNGFQRTAAGVMSFKMQQSLKEGFGGSASKPKPGDPKSSVTP
jgi:hypothetical protein